MNEERRNSKDEPVADMTGATKDFDWEKEPGLTALLVDVQGCEAQYEMQRQAGAAFNLQFWRRMYLRAAAAFVEALIFRVKAETVGKAESLGVDLTEKELAMLSEEEPKVGANGECVVRTRFTPFKDHLKEINKVVRRLSQSAQLIDFNATGWQAACAMMEKRNRVTHPKSDADVLVSDDDFSKIGKSVEWCQAAIGLLLIAVRKS